MTANEISESWRRYKVMENCEARDRLIQHYAYLVKITAGRIVSNLPPSMERDDLVSAGVVGLIKAVDNFDTTRQVKFETYAIALIRGAMLEMLREDDWVPRSVRDNLKMLERTYVQLETALGRPALEHEVAEAMDMEPERFNRLLVEASRTSLMSLEEALVGSEGSEKLHLSDVLHDDSATPTLEAEIGERKRMLAKSIDRLPERERHVVSLYYYEGLTFKEIGRILTISESRVYQLHTQAVVRLQGYLTRDVELFR